MVLTDLDPVKLVETARQISFEDLPSPFDALLKGHARRHSVVKCSL
jgi:hypothetical protein